MEVTGKLKVHGTRNDAELVVQTLYSVLPKYGKAFIDGSVCYKDAYEVRYEYSVSTATEQLKIKAKICWACNKLRLIPRIKAIKHL